MIKIEIITNEIGPQARINAKGGENELMTLIYTTVEMIKKSHNFKNDNEALTYINNIVKEKEKYVEKMETYELKK